MAQFGVKNVAVSTAGETVEFTVAFPKKYSTNPQIVASIATRDPKNSGVSILFTSTTEFTGYLYRGTTPGTVDIRWIAIGV